MYDEDNVLEKTRWLGAVVAVGVSTLLVVLGALLMRWVELNYSHSPTVNPTVAPTFDVYQPNQELAVTQRITEGYLGARALQATTATAVTADLGNEAADQAEPLTISKVFRSLLGIYEVQAAEPAEYQAELVSQTYSEIRLAPQRSFTVTAEFKNTGTAAWTNAGSHFIALNVAEPAGRHSQFQHPYWTEYYYRPTRLKQAEVKPGETGQFTFALQAPSQPGTYREIFGLVAEDLAWLPGGQVSVVITVPEPYEAKLMAVAYPSVQVEPGRAFTYWVDFKNTGTTTWTNTGSHFIALNVDSPSARASQFKHSYWPDWYRPALLKQSQVKPGEIGRFTFALQAPTTSGMYIEGFGLVAENITWLPGGKVSVPIQVGQVLPAVLSQGEPSIRVGLFTTNEQITVTGNGPFAVRTGSNALLASLLANDSASVQFSAGGYTVTAGGRTLLTTEAIRFVPDSDTILEISSYQNRPAWNTQLNDNRFRGVIEVRWAEETKQLWVINELPLEAYLRGVAETSNSSPIEFQKALMTAARSYALYHILTGTKHKVEGFTVDAAYDQVYRGYGFEARSPQVTEAVEATRGVVVAYQDTPVITPYFSHSDGRTRAWEEVWAGGPYPWLVSVPDPASAGLDMYGHGVGMSAQGALQMGADGQTYDAILKYFYVNTGLRDLY